MASVPADRSDEQTDPPVLTNMKSFVVLSLLVAAALAAPADKDAQVLRNILENIGVDGYNFDFETSNGIKQQEQGQVQNPGAENEAIAVRGSYSYLGPDNVVYTVTYVADENGFQPQGDHIPKAA